ncbi:proline-rich receptor-like protein kinase PERK2 isoform X2 [Oryza glaberrima]|uniref:non-specific serine/threonine protein kinase n=3 Tax=Oryza TaxID=4527 RepID=A0A0D3EU15_9ORYZ|nr:proline-rich receptor-like protein kinase PERK2 isoform X2 [Oryza glaberrima]
MSSQAPSAPVTPAAPPPQTPPVTPPPVTAPPPVSPPPVTPPPVTPPPVSPPPVSPPPVTPPPVSPPPVTPPPVSPPPVTPPTPVAPPPVPPSPPPPTPTPTPVTPSPPPPVTPSPPPPVASPPPPDVPTAPPPSNNPPSPPPSPSNVPASPPPPRISLSPPPPPSTPTQSGASSGSKSSNNGTVVAVGVAVAAVVVLGLAAGLIYFFVSKRRRRRQHPPAPHHPGYPPFPAEFYDPHRPPSQQQSHALSPSPSSTPPLLLQPHSFVSSGGASEAASAVPGIAMMGGAFGYDELAAAADGFSESNLLGQGGFGQVYKGTVRGQEVAIKKLRSGSGQGEREFQAEVEIISRVHHKNLVSLVGYCIYGEQRLLVYEYVPNKTLEFHLHGSGRPALDWPRRWKIAVGSAKGLAYLHEDCHPKIIHRDIKAANILLDYTFEPKVADFGLAKYQATEQTAVSTRVMGTFGYLAPEYAATGKVNDRSDVFSFGVMLLELITGKKPIMVSHGDQPDTLVSWARPLLVRAVEEENFEELVDPRLENNYDAYDMGRLIACAAAAVRHTARSRPRMSQIVRYLEGELAAEDLNAGVTPGQSAMQRTSGGTTDQMKRLRKMAFGSATGTGTVSEYTSSEFSEPTSEYGLNPSTEYTTSAAGGDTGEVTVDVQMTAGASGEAAGTERLSRRTTARRGGRV